MHAPAPQNMPEMFDCARLSARLSQTGCARRWEEAQIATGQRLDQFLACRGCPLGAQHAGKAHVSYSAMYGAAICPRCRKGTSRMIFNRVCVSCRNREYEVETGRNRRGNKPVEVIQRVPRRQSITVIRDGVAIKRAEDGVDILEPMLQTMRTAKGSVSFAFAGQGWRAAQGRLL